MNLWGSESFLCPVSHGGTWLWLAWCCQMWEKEKLQSTLWQQQNSEWHCFSGRAPLCVSRVSEGQEVMWGEVMELWRMWEEKEGRCLGQGIWISLDVPLTFKLATFPASPSANLIWLEGLFMGNLTPEGLTFWYMCSFSSHVPLRCEMPQAHTYSVHEFSPAMLCQALPASPAPLSNHAGNQSWLGRTCKVSVQLQGKIRENRAWVMAHHSPRQPCSPSQP